MLTLFDRIHEHDVRTDGQTPNDGTGRACSLARLQSRGKNSGQAHDICILHAAAFSSNVSTFC